MSHSHLSEMSDLLMVSPVRWKELLQSAPSGGVEFTDPFEVVRPVYYYPPGILKALHGRCLFWSTWGTLKKNAKSHDAQVMLASFAYPDGYAGLIASRKLGLPMVLQVIGSDLMVLGKDPARGPMVRKVLREADRIIAVSSGLAKEACNLGASPEKVTWVPNGVDQKSFTPGDKHQARKQLGLSSDGPWLLFVGNFVGVKSVDTLLNALKQIPRARLMLVGAGPLHKQYQALAEENRIASRLHWAGSQPHSNIPQYMAASDILVLPSKSEGEPNVTIEALASGRPVVASRVGGIPDIVSDKKSGRLVTPGDPRELARAIQWVLERNWDPEAIRSTVARRTWPQTARGYLEVLQKALHG
jgi:teichuronic acid biosynthesis glycosyltransferase TuaC